MTDGVISHARPLSFSFPHVPVVVQIAKHDGPEPVGASGVCRSASSRQ